MSDYEIRGIKELSNAFNDVVKNYPYEAEKTLQKLGNRFRRAVITKTPVTEEKRRKKLSKSYKTEIVGYKTDIQLNFWSNAPHFHLVERGHRNVGKNGRVYGFTPGKRMVEKTVQEFESIMPEEAEKFVKKIVRKME